MSDWRNWLSIPLDVYQQWKQSRQGNELAGYPGFSCQFTKEDDADLNEPAPKSNPSNYDNGQLRSLVDMSNRQ